MPTPPLSDELAKQAADAYRAAGNHATAASAAELGIPLPTYKNRLKVATLRGLLLDTQPPIVMPGMQLDVVTTLPNGKQSVRQRREFGEVHEPPKDLRRKGVTALVDGATGRVMHQHIMYRDPSDGPDPLQVAELIKQAFVDYQPAAPITAPPQAAANDLLTLIPLADWHIGMFAWAGETGQNWDLKIAERTIGAGIEDLISRTPSSGRAVVLGGGDLIHSDNNDNKTSKSNNPLQVDGRYDKTIMVACRLVERTVALALQRHGHVTLRVLKGNHDKHASVAVAYHLLGLYRNEPRVTVDVDPSLYWWMRFGRVLLGSTHGDEVKITNMPGIMAHRRAEDWGLTKFRYVHGFHLHHSAKYATEGGGVISEVHQAPIPQDAWHYGAGFLSGRSLQAITYHSDFGEIGRVRTAILDAEVPA